GERVAQLAAGPQRVFGRRLVMQAPEAPRQGAHHRGLQGLAVPCHGVRREAVVGQRVGHVGHVFEARPLGVVTGEDGRPQETARQQRRPGPHGPTCFSVTLRAPLSSNRRRASPASNVVSRRRSTRAKTSSVVPRSNSAGRAPGNSLQRARKAATVTSPALSTVSSKAIGTKASVELAGLPPTLRLQSSTAQQNSRAKAAAQPPRPAMKAITGRREGCRPISRSRPWTGYGA